MPEENDKSTVIALREIAEGLISHEILDSQEVSLEEEEEDIEMSFNIAAINSGETERMSQQPAEHATESYFVAQLAEHAKQSSVAAPATLPSLVKNLSYLSQDELALVKSAHAYAEQAHQGQSRRTGHAYITHPTAVAQILSNMRMDPQTIMAAFTARCD